MTSVVKTLPIEFNARSFPLIGLVADDNLKSRIEEERRVSAEGVSGMEIPAVIQYTDMADNNKVLDVEALEVSRENDRLVMNAKAKIYGQNDSYVSEAFTVASASMSVVPLLKILREYTHSKSRIQEEVVLFHRLGKLNAMEKIDAHRSQLHLDISRAISDRFGDNKDITLVLDTGRAEFAPWRYLSTAVMMHILPAPVFRDKLFLAQNIKPK